MQHRIPHDQTPSGVAATRRVIVSRQSFLALGRRCACALIALVAVLFTPLAASAEFLNPAIESSKYLIIGTGDAGVVGTSSAVSNSEIGAIQAPVPMPGLTLIEPIPPNTLPVQMGISGDGDVAITNVNGTFDFSNLDIFATMGVQTAGSAVDANDGASNTTFNTLPFPANGLMGNVDFSSVLAEFANAKSVIPGLVGDNNILLDLSGDGKFSPNTVFNLLSGLTMIDIDTGGNDLLLENTNLVFDGPAGAFAIVRVPSDANFNVVQSAILIGDGGIGLNNVLFFSDKPDSNAHFNFNSLLVNGVAFWDLSMAGGESSWNDVQGCTQIVCDKINLNDVRLMTCAFNVPESASFSLLGIGLASLAVMSSYRRSTGGRRRHTRQSDSCTTS